MAVSFPFGVGGFVLRDALDIFLMGKFILIFVLAASSVSAKPWYKDKANWLIIAGAAAADIYATSEISNCRSRNDIIHCPDGGYGPFHGREGVRGGISILSTSLTIYGRQHWKHGWRNELINDAPVAIWAGWNTAVGWSDHQVPNYHDAERFRVKP